MKEPDQTWWNLNRIQSWVNSTVPMLVPKLWQTYQGPIESPLDCKEIKSVNLKGNQSWIFIGRTDAEAETPILWPPDAKSQLIRKDLMLGKIEGRRRRGQQRMRWLDGWHHQVNGHEFEQTPVDSEGQGSLTCCSPWSHKESDTTQQLNNIHVHLAKSRSCNLYGTKMFFLK